MKQGDYVMVESGLLHAVGRVGVGAANLLGIDSRRDIVNLDVCIMGQHLPQMYRERECTPLDGTDMATHGFCVACRGWGLTSVDEAATVDQVIDGQGGAVCGDCGGSGRKGMIVTVVREPGSAEGHIEMAADAAEGVTCGMCAPAYGRWVPVGKIEPGQPPGSMSDNREDGGRDIYLFGLLGPADRACVWRTVGGVDAEVGSARVVASGASEVVAQLDEPGETYEIELRTDRSTARRRVRFALRSD